ncbi:hypothetical protein [Virgibacillus siamensis]|uniref:hypothetical protein n=1 Tax=Virgibacillus siamensis TaxID=480071 RepID=UPI000987CDE5|nr:hypothetical protein [Virgibacillus siamensis]
MVTKTRIVKFICTMTVLYLFAVSISTADTFAWFTSESNAHGTMVNATTNDLLSIQADVISYKSNCEVKVAVTIQNTSKIAIPIRLANYQESLSPGETYSKEFQEKPSCVAAEIQYPLQGFTNYINETIHIPLDQKKLEEASRNGHEKIKPESTGTKNNEITDEVQNPTKDMG